MRLGILSDLHWNARGGDAAWHNPYDFEGVPPRLDVALRRFADEAIDAIAILGDVTHRGDTRSMIEALGLFDRAGRPVWVVSGNHDLLAGVDQLRKEHELRAPERVLLARPEGELLSNGMWLAGLSACADDRSFSMRFPDSTNWDIAPAIVLSHFPVLSIAPNLLAAGLKDAGNACNREEVAERLLRRSGPTIVICGHLHVRASMTDGSLLQLANAALIEAPYELTLVEIRVEGEHVEVRRRALSLPGKSASHLPVLTEPFERFCCVAGEWRVCAIGNPAG